MGVVGRGRLGIALGLAAQSAGHDAVLLRRPSAPARRDSPLPEEALGRGLDWERFDLVLLAFEKKASSVAELETDPGLLQLRRISPATPVASVVMTPPPEVVDAFLPDRAIAHFLTTPAARLPGAIALLPRRPIDATRLKAALPDLYWIEADEREYARLAVLMVGSGIAAAALAHLVRLRGEALTSSEAEYLQHVLDDAKRILRLNDGDGFRAFASVATPGGYTERLHNAIFSTKWPLDS